MDDISDFEREIRKPLEKLFGENSKQTKLHDVLCKTSLFPKLLESFNLVFKNIYDLNNPLNLKKDREGTRLQSMKTKMEWLRYIRINAFSEFLPQFRYLSEEGAMNLDVNEDDFLWVLQIYGEGILSNFCVKRRNEAISRQTEGSTRPTQDEDEYDPDLYCRSLLSIGGGCMGEIWRVSKRRSNFGKYRGLTEKEIANAETLYASVMKLRQTEVEKAEILFSGIKLRDRGGLFIPKASLIPYLSKLSHLCNTILNESGIKTHGHKILEALIDKIEKHRNELEEIFLNCVGELIPKELSLVFLKELQRKFIHACSNEFITAQDEKEKEVKNIHSKGCNGLRDELFVISKGPSSRTTTKCNTLSSTPALSGRKKESLPAPTKLKSGAIIDIKCETTPKKQIGITKRNVIENCQKLEFSREAAKRVRKLPQHLSVYICD